MKLFIFSAICLLLIQVFAKGINLDNKVTFVGGITEGLDFDDLECDIEIEEGNNYAAVSERVFNITNECSENYVIAMSSIPEEVANEGYPMFKARVVDMCEECDEAQIIVGHETYKNFTKADTMANIIWMVINKEGNVSLKANYIRFHNFTEYVGIPPEEIKRLFEVRALEMLTNDIQFRDWPWEGETQEENDTTTAIPDSEKADNQTTIVTDGTEEENEDSHGLIYVSAVGAAAIGLACFVGYKRKGSIKKTIEREDSLAIPAVPAVDSTINNVSSHPDGLPRVDIYNPPLEYYHFPMDTSYDIVDLRPDIYDE